MNVRHLVTYLFLAFACFSTLSLTGCGAVHKAARSIGVKATTVTLKATDLGSGYDSIANTEWDFFSSKSGSDQVKVSYKKVGISSIDTFNRAAAILYGQYIFADKTLDKTIYGLREIFDISLDKKTVNEVIKAIKKRDADQITKVRELKKIKNNVTFSVKSLAGMTGKASDLVSSGKALYEKVPGEVAADPKRVLLTDIALAEVKTSISRSSDVLKGSPNLLKKLNKIKDVLMSVAKYI